MPAEVFMQRILILDDDRTTTETIATLLEGPGRAVVLCGDVESAELVLERVAPDYVLTNLRLSNPFRCEELEFVRHVKLHAPQSRVIVMTAETGEGLKAEALRCGADAVLRKPVGLEALARHVPGGISTEEPLPLVRVPSIDEVIESDLLAPSYQPIVELASDGWVIHGFESLARYEGEFLADPLTLFDYAARKGRLIDLELVCLRSSLLRGTRLAAMARLFLNVHPAVIRSERLTGTLTVAAALAGVAPEHTVIEITEQGSLGDSAVVRRRCQELRDRGFSFALDDIAMAYSHLAHIDEIQPRYLKISPDFGSGFEANGTRRKIVKHALSLARDFGCELILEGIESSDTRDAAQDLGVRLGQGFLFHRPAAADRFFGSLERGELGSSGAATFTM
jgi:EAL domain-containing protein (putative c-di-GMP-specific phosphodiesterase class I)/ActR/RegA family two-component response regulator